ncbi:hypothetical protein GCM10009862_22000 [Microbacterium binotii]|uniref:Uncharacterized protein n=1 Tax=Microbacterium binotii TaxID=462710 RepID=A0ABN3PEY1_9MICO
MRVTRGDEALLAVRCDGDLVPRRCQAVLDQLRHIGVVLYDQDARHGRHLLATLASCTGRAPPRGTFTV